MVESCTGTKKINNTNNITMHNGGKLYRNKEDEQYK